jgi:hypothetical protein
MEMGDQLQVPAALPPTKNLRTHFTGGSVGSRAGLDDLPKRYVSDEIATDTKFRGHLCSVVNAIQCAATCYKMF